MKKSLLGLLIGTLFLSGCSTTQPQAPATPVLNLPEKPIRYVPGELNRESLYQLLRAEMAGQQHQFGQALAIYLEQARLTGDPAVAERATRIAQYLQRPDEMLKAARLWIKAQPDDPEPYQLAASLLLHKGDYAAALPLMEHALETDSQLTLGLLASQADNMTPDVLKGYIAMLDRQLARTPDDRLLLLTRGQLYKQLDQTDKALADFDRAIALDANDIDAVMMKAELLRLHDRGREALKLLRPYRQSQADNRQLQVLYVQLLFQTGAKDQGTRAARRLSVHFPDDTRLQYYLALLMLENGRLDDSRKALEQLIEDNPDDTAPYFYLGYIAQQQGHKEKAIEEYGRVEEGPNLFQSYARTLNLLDRVEDRPRMEQILDNARTRYPEMAARLYTLQAEWLNLHVSREAALTVLDDALKKLGNDVDLLYTRAMMIEPDNYAQMEKDLRKVLELDPDNANALNALGYTLTIHTDRYQEAYKLIEHALKQQPDNPAVLDSMGWVLFKLKRYPEAIDYLQRAYDAYPDPEVASHLIRAYWIAGHKNRARELLQKHLSEDPQNEHLRDAAQALGVE